MKTLRKSRKIDPDIIALKACIRALNKCNTRRMVKATLEFAWDFYIGHPSPQLPEHLKP